MPRNGVIRYWWVVSQLLISQLLWNLGLLIQNSDVYYLWLVKYQYQGFWPQMGLESLKKTIVVSFEDILTYWPPEREKTEKLSSWTAHQKFPEIGNS